MNRTLRNWVAGLGVLLLGTPALATFSQWTRWGSSTSSDSMSAQAGWYYSDFVTGDTRVTGPLDTSACVYFNVFFLPSVTDGSTLAEVQIYGLMVKSDPFVPSNERFKILTDIDGGVVDDVTLNGDDGTGGVGNRQSIYGAVAPAMYFTVGTQVGAGDTARVMVQCVPY